VWQALFSSGVVPDYSISVAVAGAQRLWELGADNICAEHFGDVAEDDGRIFHRGGDWVGLG
jgi:hypothetical protein